MKDEKSKERAKASAAVLILYSLKSLFPKRQHSQKHTMPGKSGMCRKESKKGYTGDALALRGEERRDKLR